MKPTRAAKLKELTAPEVVLELRGNETEIRRCFFANPSARGVVRYGWRVAEDGRVSEVKREESTLAEPRIESCLAERLSELRFEPREAPASAHWTFVFRLLDPEREKALRKQSKRRRPHRDDRGVEIEKTSPGFLAPDVVDNVVESGFGLFARCYRDGVQRNEGELSGAVRLRFVVNESGSVDAVDDIGSDLSDRQVIDCVAEGFYSLRFPEPERGNVNVLYRIQFDSG